MAREYKDSGIEWIGRIPKEWKMQPLSIYFGENSKPNFNLDSINALQFKYGEIIQKPTNGRELNDKDFELLSKYTMVAPNDIVVNGLNLNYDLKSLRIARVREEGIITSAYIVLRPRNGANSSFYNYYLKALDFQKVFHGMGVGIRLTLSYNELRGMLLPVPSFEEQQRIADYLDEKCGEIDSLISLQEQMIAQLTDYKQSVITEAVTKGLDPNALLVPSGIEWVENMPKGWCAKKVKYISNNISKGNGITKDEIFADGDIPCVRYGEIYSRYGNSFEKCFSYTKREIQKAPHLINKGDILCACTGELVEEIGKSIVYMGNEPCLAGGDIIIINHSQNPVFLNYALNSNYAQAQKSKGKAKLKVVHISAYEIGSVYILLPSTNEQRTIAEYLDNKCAEIDALISLKQQKIETLKDYKKSLIFEAVTGKIEVE